MPYQPQYVLPRIWYPVTRTLTFSLTLHVSLRLRLTAIF